jgi:small GTP-binding protein
MRQPASADSQYAVKIVLAGESGVGKTNLLLRFARGRFNDDSKATIGVEFATKTVDIDGEAVKANIWDTAGQELFRAITAKYYRGANGAMLVYDITSSTSFANVGRWLHELRTHADPNVPIMLIGNKLDLTDQRSVTTEEGQNFAERERLLFIEGSAKSAANIEQAFTKLIGETLRSIKTTEIGQESKGMSNPQPMPGLAVEKPSGCC